MEYAILGVYAVSLFVVGAYFTKRNETAAGFYLANRSFGPIITALTYFATYISAAALVGGTGMVFRIGPATSWYGLVSAIAVFVAWTKLGPKLKVLSAKKEYISIPDYFEDRFASKGIRPLVSIIMVLFLVPQMVSQYTAAGLLFQNFLGIPYNVAVIAFGAVVLIYAATGGYGAVAITDCIQAIVMVVGLLVLVPIILYLTGVPIADFVALKPEATTIWPTGTEGPELAVFCLLSFFGGMGSPMYLKRFYAINSIQSIKKGTKIAVCGVVFITLVQLVLGIGGRVMYPDIAADQVAITMMQNHLPRIAGMFVLTAFAAAMMSSLDSVLLEITSTFHHDIMKKTLKLNISESRSMGIARIITIIIGCISIFWGLFPPALLAWLFWPAWGGLGFVVGSLTVLGLYWKPFNKYGAITLSVVGVVTMLTWYALGHPFGINAFFVTLAVTLPLTVIVTLATQKRTAQSA